MDLCFITPMALQEHPLEEISQLLERDDGYVWLDVPDWTQAASRLLTRVFGFHPVAIEFCRTRNHMPVVHGYSDHVFLTLHRPFLITHGHVRTVELDLFVGDRFLVTVHGPVDSVVPPQVPMDEVRETLDRIRARRIWPETPTALMYALVSLIARGQRLAVQDIAGRVAQVSPSSVDEMFLVRQELLAVGTMASLDREVLARTRRLLPKITAADLEPVAELEDMLERVERTTDRERELLAGAIERYRTRTDTKMMIGVERLVLLASAALVTAIGSVLFAGFRWIKRRGGGESGPNLSA
jgi:Mg2+ and Co2+ transporter CorA